MRRLTAILLTSALAACGGGDHEADEGAMPAAAEPTATAISLADVAGTWNMVSMADTLTVPYVMTATDTEMGWTVTFPGREPIPVQVELVDGDSVVTVTGPFESVLHAGEMVTSRNVMRLQDGMLTGNFTATYDNPEIPGLSGTSEGARAEMDDMAAEEG